MSDQATGGTLGGDLQAYRAGFNERATDDIKDLYEWGVRQVAESGLVERATGEGDIAPAFTLKDANGTNVSLESILASGPAVIVWYRGG